MPKAVKHFYEFGPFRLDPEKHRLLRDGELVHLSPKSVEALVVLVQNAGKLLDREALMQAVWADTFVEDANLTVAISNLRKALGQNGEAAEYIETIPRVGYRFVADVRERIEEQKPLIIEKRTQSRTVIEEELWPDHQSETVAALVVPDASPVVNALPVTKTRRQALIVAAAVLIIALGSLLYFRRGAERNASTTNLASAGIRSIAVLPPKPLANESENGSLSLGIADALITRLGGINRLTVRPTSAVARFVGANQDPLKAGSALGVDAVLDGTLQRDHGRTRVTLRLLNVANGNQLWAGNFDEADSDVFKLQDSISQNVGNALYSDLSHNQQAVLTQQQTTNKEAYALYLQGNYFWNKRGSEALKSIDYFRKAIELDPNFAQAYVNLAAIEATAVGSTEAEALITKALRLDNTSSDAHATYGFIKMFDYWDWADAEKELDLAIDLNPNSSTPHHWKGVYLSIRGRLDEAKAEMHRALELDPLSLIIMTDIAQLHYFAHEYDQAAEYCNRVLSFDPQFHDAHTYLVDIYRMKGLNQEALKEVIQDYSMNPRVAEATEKLFAREGLRGVFNWDLQARLNQWKSENVQRSIRGLMIGREYCRLGENDQALKWLAVATEKPESFWTPYLNVDPIYDPLRSDPRFKQIITKLGLA